MAQFVGDGQLLDLERGELTQAAAQLRQEHRFGLPRLALFQLLADAHDGVQPALERSHGLLENGLLGLPEVLPPLAVPDDDPLRSHIHEHGRGNFAGECAFLGPVEVLAADLHLASRSGCHRRRNVHEGRGDHDVAVLGLGDLGEELLKKTGRLGRGLVQLPIACDQRPSHRIAFRKLIPFSR
jgi:hypothetical protein